MKTKSEKQKELQEKWDYICETLDLVPDLDINDWNHIHSAITAIYARGYAFSIRPNITDNINRMFFLCEIINSID